MRVIISITGKVVCVNDHAKITRNIFKSGGPDIDPCGTSTKISARKLYFGLAWVNNHEPISEMEEIVPTYTASQSKVNDWGNQTSFERSVNNAPNASLLPKAFFHFSNMGNIVPCVSWPFLNLHWYFDKILSK